jgi:hypothetical protein
LEEQVAKVFPAQAIAVLKQRGPYAGPLYNTFGWGGYLMYHYPQLPVCIDGRTLVHGEARVVHSANMQHGEDDWQSDQELSAARLLILPRRDTITLLVRLDKRFEVEYEDDVAVVFVRRLRAGESNNKRINENGNGPGSSRAASHRGPWLRPVSSSHGSSVVEAAFDAARATRYTFRICN